MVRVPRAAAARRVALTALLVAALLLAALGPALASPQPDPVCGACGSAFEDAAEEEGVTVNVTNSTATVHVHANGSATWVVTNRVNESAADRLRETPALLDRVGKRAATAGWGLPGVDDGGDVQFGSAEVDGRTVTIRFVDSNAGQWHAGVLVIDYLHTEGIRGGWILNADTFTIVGPPGTTVVNDPSAAIDREFTPTNAVPTVDGRRVTWHGSVGTEYEAAFYDDVYLAFGDAGTPGWRVDGALALATVPIWLDNIQAFVFPAVVVYGVLLAGVAVATRRVATVEVDPGRFATAVAAVGAVGVVAGVLAPAFDQPGWFAGATAVYLVTGIAALVRPDAFRSVRGGLGVGGASLAGIGAVLGGVSLAGGGVGVALGVGGGVGSSSFVSLIRGVVVHLPLAVAPAFGIALARASRHGSRRASLGAFLGALASLAVAGAVFVPVASRPFGLVIIFTVGGAVLAAVLGLPLAALAARLWTSTGASADVSDDRSTVAD